MKHPYTLKRLMVLMIVTLLTTFSVNAQEIIPLPGANNQEGKTPAHYLVLEADAQGNITVVSHQQVMMDTLVTLSNEAFAHFSTTTATRDNDSATVQLFDQSGTLAFQTVVEIPRWMRGEFEDDQTHEDESNIDGHLFPLEKRSFVVRVPVIGAGATLDIQPNFATTRNAPLNLDVVAQQFPAAAGVAEFIPGWNHGASSNRLDILILGDGYTSSQESKFRNDSDLLINRMFAISPYYDYHNYVNVRRVFTVSQQAGADTPVCNDSSTTDDETYGNGNTVNTAFDAKFCTNGIWRLLTVNGTKINTAAAADANWDEILVIVNTDIYGGSGGSFATASLHNNSVKIMQHEFGHSFGKLADEYTTAYPGFPACSDTNSSSSDNCEANVTNQTTRNLIKWNRWIASTTQIPTSGAIPGDELGAGLWQGARYLTSGMYRQCNNGIMRSLGRPFCDVDGEAVVLRMYNGGWGTPSAGINTFEAPSPSSTSLTLLFGQTQNFSAKVLASHTSNATARWYIGGELQKTQTLNSGGTTSYLFPLRPAGTWTVTLKVTDNSPLVHNTVRNQTVASRTWTIKVVDPCPFCIMGEDENLLKNGDFEKSGGFETAAKKWNTSDHVLQVTDHVHGGTNALMLTADVVETVKATQKVKTPFGAAGNTLEFSGWFSTTDLTGKAKVQLNLTYADGSTEKVTIDPVTGTGYTQTVHTMTLRDTVSKVTVKVMVKPGSGVLYADDLSLKLVSGTSNAQLDTSNSLIPAP